MLYSLFAPYSPPAAMNHFTGKTVIVTGAGRGLGAAFAAVLAGLGARVIMTGRNREMLTSAAEAIRSAHGVRPETHSLDLADPGEVTRWAKSLRDLGAPVDILINNGARWLPGAMDSHDAYAIVTTISSAVTGTLLLTRGLIP